MLKYVQFEQQYCNCTTLNCIFAYIYIYINIDHMIVYDILSAPSIVYDIAGVILHQNGCYGNSTKSKDVWRLSLSRRMFTPLQLQVSQRQGGTGKNLKTGHLSDISLNADISLNDMVLSQDVQLDIHAASWCDFASQIMWKASGEMCRPRLWKVTCLFLVLMRCCGFCGP